MIDKCLLQDSLISASNALARGEVSSVELTQASLEQIDDLDQDIHAFVTVDYEGALRCAAKVDREIGSGHKRGRLHGIPIGIKDNIPTAELRTTFNSRAYESWIPTQDAVVVARLRDAGSVILGKTNLNEFAWSIPSATDSRTTHPQSMEPLFSGDGL